MAGEGPPPTTTFAIDGLGHGLYAFVHHDEEGGDRRPTVIFYAGRSNRLLPGGRRAIFLAEGDTA